MAKVKDWQGILKSLGPGICFAGAAVGVSHVVQSTRAGALYGFALLGIIILINLVKFPFFEYGPRYVAATGESLLAGYKRCGAWVFYLFVFLSFLTMFIVQAAVTMVTAGLFANLLNITASIVLCSILVLFICGMLLVIGKYAVLDKMMKFMICLLSIGTVVAFIAAFMHGSMAQPQFSQKFTFDLVGVSFLLALMGWMPAPIEVSVWHSFWSEQRIKQTNHKPNLFESLFDFHVGYWGTAILALLFLSLGAFVMYGTGEEFSNSAVVFTGQVISLYTKSLGEWSYPFIVVAATATMFSTTLSVLDAYCRVLQESLKEIVPDLKNREHQVYICSMVALFIGAVVIIAFFSSNMKLLIDFAAIISFLSAPIFAYMNLHTITSEFVPAEFRPGKGLVIYSWFGIAFLTIFSLIYLIFKFNPNII